MPRIRVGGVEARYDESGAGAPVVCLVHGTGGTGSVWMRQLEGLADVARVVTPDLPGHGGTAGPVSRTIAEASAFVARFLDALGVDRVAIGGHSMGGAIAQEFALTHPARVIGLALVGTGARLRVLPRLLELLETDYPAGVDLLMQMGVGAGAAPALRATLHRETAANPAAVVVGDLRSCDVFDALARVATISAPTVAICGEEDQLTPPKYSRFFGERIAGARVVIVPGSGHYVQVEQPDAVTTALRELVTSLPAPAPLPTAGADRARAG
jgi:pimeloyl-ACP methyl ester carboxylesterase